MMVHATAIAQREAGLWRAVLLFGESGAGKSDLALRALHAGWRLVSDDYTVVWRAGAGLWARAPENIANRFEVRGLGILVEPAVDLAQVVLAVKCESEAVERLPEPEVVHLEDFAVPCVRLRALDSSALAKLQRALSTRALGAPL